MCWFSGSVLHFRKMVCFVDFSKFVVYFQHVSCVNSGSPCQHAHDMGLIWAIMWHSHGPAAHLLAQYWGVKMMASGIMSRSMPSGNHISEREVS